MKKILIGFAVLISVSVKAQVQYGGVIRALSNAGTLGQIGRNNDQLKTWDSTANVTLSAINGKITAVNTGAVVVSSSALPSLAATSTKQSDGSQKTQIVDGSGNVIGATSNALDINIKSGFGSTIAVTNTGTFATQIDGSALTSLQLIDDPVRSEDEASADGHKGFNILAVRKATPVNTSGTDGDYESLQMSAGRLWTSSTIDAALPTGSNVIGAVTQSGTWNVGSITTLPSLVAGTALIGKVGIDQTTVGTTNAVSLAQLGANTIATGNGASSTGVLRVAQVNDGTGVIATVSTVTNLSQLGGQAIAMNTGTRSAGTQRVTIATDDVVPASQSGTWTVQPGNTQNTTAWLTANTPVTSGGLTTYHLVSAGSTNATSVKASAGQLYGYYIFNANAAARKVAFHNTSGTPTAGSSVFFSLVIPAGSAANVEFANGVAFSSGIGITTTTGTADTDAVAVASGDLIINLYYK